ncbi:hypothetical protein [Campylobacter gracilis]|uniref:Uncharacterized protein n=1 Tax=Campylobacter gracilis RM3268 TaxID=553220 RepID=C8PGE9_9BACT|nr:hypothetical protein [Campylobacter gracilis]EEV18187.1 hypothetical protein CAMGR0001_0942 [Campylobacter gracilis RM3268]UEB45242.1 hypothetical protein LK410_09675 [Campylobacter gracilis]
MKFYAAEFRELKFLAEVKFNAAKFYRKNSIYFEILNLRIPLPHRA